MYAGAILAIFWNTVPLDINTRTVASLCTLSSWSVRDDSRFIEALAWLYLQKPNHADRIVRALAPKTAGLPGRIFEGALRLLKYDSSDLNSDLLSTDKVIKAAAKKKLDARVAHRDGLLFQHISWLAASAQFPNALKAPPHARAADKGFDGVLLNIETMPIGVSSLILCEDKASIKPRPIVTSQVWPEIKTISTGDRDVEITASVTSLLSNIDEDEREEILNAVTWEKVIQFRVALAAGMDQRKEGEYKHLFDGFDKINPTGRDSTRYAEIMPMPDVRLFLDEIAAKVSTKLVEMKSNV